MIFAVRCYASAARVIFGVCLCVTFVHSVKTNKHLRYLFTVWEPSHSSLSVPNGMAILRRELASNAGVVSKNHDSELTSGLTACC